MKITKLGISTALLSVICFYFAFTELWVAVALMVVVLVLDLDNKVKRNSIQAVVAFGALQFVYLIYEEIMNLINEVFKVNPNEIHKWIDFIYDKVLIILLIYCLFNVLKNKIVYIPGVSEFVSKHVGQKDK
ncbi:MAG: hypothetical protein ACLFMO_04220 [Eubacteriales bacterium]